MSYRGNKGGHERGAHGQGVGEDGGRKGIDSSTLSTRMKLPKKPFEMSLKETQVFLTISCYFY